MNIKTSMNSKIIRFLSVLALAPVLALVAVMVTPPETMNAA